MATNPLPGPATPTRPGVLPPSHLPPALAPAATAAAPPAHRYLSPLAYTVPPAAGASDTCLPVTPPSKFKRFKIFIKSARKERKKKAERRSVEGAPGAAPPSPLPWGGPAGATPPSRRTFRLTSPAPGPGCERSMLPLWLEETNGVTFPITIDTATRKEIPAVDHDTSFEKRWDSLRNKGKIHSERESQRPPGWDDVGHRCAGKKTDKASFRPSFVIQAAEQAWPTSALSTPLPAPPGPTRARTAANKSVTEPEEGDPLDCKKFTEQVDSLFPDPFLQAPKHSSSTSDITMQSNSDIAPTSTSNLVPESTSTSNMTSQSTSTSNIKTHSASTSTITDCHMWISSDSFFCENFTFCDSGPRDARNSEAEVTPAACLTPGSDSDQENSDVLEVPSPGRWTASLESLRSMTGMEGQPANTPTDRLSTSEDVHASPSSDCSKCTEDGAEHTVEHFEALDSTLRVADVAPRQHWVQFDGSSEKQWNVGLAAPQEVTSTPTDGGQRTFDNVEESNPPTNAPSPVTQEKTKPSVAHSSGAYGGRLLRTYSQRGCRASKRVINSVSRRRSVTDYGRLTEPVPPMYSKAVMTMQSGPGLFEAPPARAEPVCIQSPSQERLEDLPVKEKPKSQPSQSLLAPSAPRRSGSVRLPRLPATLVRRSLSLNTPHVKQGDVPFQRLPDRRPGSFRRAISGLGALARSLRRKSQSGLNSEATTNESSEAASHVSAGLQRSDSLVDGGTGKRTPQAPRLPRRATSQKFVVTPDSDRPAPIV